MDRDACLLVNPAAGGGKAARVLPDVEAELRRLGVAFHTEQTTSLLHATEVARAAAACQVIATGTPRAPDIGEVEGRSFIGIASLGFDSVANKIANEAPARLGNLVYAYGALRALASWRPATFTVDFDTDSRTFRG